MSLNARDYLFYQAHRDLLLTKEFGSSSALYPMVMVIRREVHR